MKRVLIIGATSAIANAVARTYAAAGDRLFLTAREEIKLEALRQDLTARGAQNVDGAVFDAMDFDAQDGIIEAAGEALGGLDIALIAHGTLPGQSDDLRHAHEVNHLSVCALAEKIGGRMEANGSGVLAVISSVAGDRGRQSNYLYGSAKAAVSTYLQGLRNRLHPKGVTVLTIKPGFVDTPMTAAFEKGALWASPDKVAGDIVRAIEKRKDVLYTPWFWRWIMLIIRLIPEPIFKRLKL